MKHPREIEWIDGDLPDVHTVPKGSSVLVWFVNAITEEEWDRCARMSSSTAPLPPDHNGQLCRIETCFPYENDLNPLRWCDSSCHPIGYHEKVVHWSWINKGTPEENAS